MRVSVIIPTYNRAALLKEAIESVRSQTYANWELIVVDDGSTDDTQSIISQNRDSRIRYFYQKNAGVSAARNRGIEESRSPLIAFLDSDDLWVPEKLERQVHVMKQHPETGLLYGQVGRYSISDSNRSEVEPLKGLMTVPELLNGPRTLFTSTVIVRRACLEQAGLFDTELHVGEDFDLFLRIAEKYPVFFLEGADTKMRIHPENTGGNVKKLYSGYLNFAQKMMKAYANQIAKPSRYEELEAKYSYLLGGLYLKEGKVSEARRLIAGAIRKRTDVGRLVGSSHSGPFTVVWLIVKPYLVYGYALARGKAARV